MDWKRRLPLLAAALWWGSLGAIGFLAVPTLFANASSPAVAGHLAAQLFASQTWLSLGCGIVLLAGARNEEGTPSLDWGGGALVYVLAGLLAALLLQFGVAPKIVARQDLAFWHTAGSVLYAAQWICALVVLWKLSGSPAANPTYGKAGTPGP